jgi:lysophospholipase L1-like esterase
VLPSKELRQVSGVAGNVLTVAALTNSYAAGAAVTSYGDAGTGSLGVWAARNATGGKVAAIGDSVTQGASPMYGAGTTVPPDTYFADWAASQVGGQFYDVRNSYLTRLAKLLGWNDANMGIQGTTAANMAGRGAADFPAYAANASATIIFAGINDVNNGTSLAGFQSSYQTLITQAKMQNPGKPVLCVLLFTPTQYLASNNSAGLKVGDYNAVIQNLAGSNGVSAVDITTGMSLSVFDPVTNTGGNLRDGLHPSSVGHQKMAVNLAALLAGPAPAGSGRASVPERVPDPPERQPDPPGQRQPDPPERQEGG